MTPTDSEKEKAVAIVNDYRRLNMGASGLSLEERKERLINHIAQGIADSRPKKVESFLERFETKFTKSKSCWVWESYRSKAGYGVFWADKRKYAHRMSWELYIGKIPSHLQIDHICRVRDCVNPKHLQLVTSKQNTLLGNGPCGINSRKKVCSNGHPFAGKNLIVDKQGRRCRECHRIKMRKQNHKRSLKLKAMKRLYEGGEK